MLPGIPGYLGEDGPVRERAFPLAEGAYGSCIAVNEPDVILVRPLGGAITCQPRYPPIRAMPFGATGGPAENATAGHESVRTEAASSIIISSFLI